MRVFTLITLIFSSLTWAAGNSTNGVDTASSGSKTLAVRSIGPGLHRYSVRLPKCGRTFSHFRIKVRGGNLSVSGAGMIFANGSASRYPYSAVFESGYASPWIAFDNFVSADSCVTQLFVDAQSETGIRPVQLTLIGKTR